MRRPYQRLELPTSHMKIPEEEVIGKGKILMEANHLTSAATVK